MFDLGRGTAITITGLEYFRMRSGGETGQTSSSVYGVLVTTLNKLYQFHATLSSNGSSNRLEERPLLLPLFHSYLNAKGFYLLKEIYIFFIKHLYEMNITPLYRKIH